ncbi:hypothetical protein EDB85DRAFT_1893101 [Lactarius pseudohatsudake]|nr:hypothetical protein EDB85DRAFT_1893101 [Lactarius pseudohatsudake]
MWTKYYSFNDPLLVITPIAAGHLPQAPRTAQCGHATHHDAFACPLHANPSPRPPTHHRHLHYRGLQLIAAASNPSPWPPTHRHTQVRYHHPLQRARAPTTTRCTARYDGDGDKDDEDGNAEGDGGGDVEGDGGGNAEGDNGGSEGDDDGDVAAAAWREW